MSRQPKDLSTFSYVILALVGRGGASAHDIVRMMRRGGVHWAASESHYYGEPKRLEQRGYLTSTIEPGRTTDRRVYQLTDLGEQSLREWLPTPTAAPRIQNEATVHLLAADLLGDDEAMARSIGAMRAQLAGWEADLASTRAGPALPHRARYLRLINDVGDRTIAMYRAWLDEVDRELRSPPDAPLG
jgi:PadR family transcriptional regulator, regulatory protein AphA